MCCRFLQTLTFLLVRGFCGSAETAWSALPYLNEGYIIPIGHDQVDFTEAGIVIAFHQPEAPLPQPATGSSFCIVAFSHWDSISGPAEAGSAGAPAADEPVSPGASGTTPIVVGSYPSR